MSDRTTMYEKSGSIEKPRGCINWKVSKSSTFDLLMLPCLVMCFLLGFFPNKFNPPRYTFSKVCFALFVGVAIVYVLSLSRFIYEINFTDLYATKITEVIHCNMYAFLEGIAVLVIYVQNGARIRAMGRLREVSSILSAKDFTEMSRFVHAKDICGFLCIFVHVFNCRRSNSSLTVRNFLSLYIMAVNFVAGMFYMNCVYTLKWCFKKTNEGLRDLRKTTTAWHDVDETETRIDHDRGHGNGLVLMRLKQFEEQHSRISDVVQLLNDTFFVQIIFAAISTFTTITFNLYFYILYSHGAELNDKFWYQPYIAPAGFYFVKFTLICWACQTATDEARKMKFTLCEIFGGTSDLSTKRRVDLFSLQLLHRNNVFTAKAIDMNLSLLAKIVGGVMMYIIILFQFLLSYVLCGP